MALIGKPGYPFYLKYLKSTLRFNVSVTQTCVAKRCYLSPIEVPIRLSVDSIVIAWSSPVAGNIRAGLYKDPGTNLAINGALIVESASIAKVGVNQKQEITITEKQLEPGIYWGVFQSDEATSKFWREAGPFSTGDAFGVSLSPCYYDLGAYGPFTDPCPAVSFVVPAAFSPVFMLRVVSAYQPITP